ncbi:HTTM domain-containing protein [Aquimarina sp. ERC-38]|uniref:HTTM domain-containing protein n=1 Tax=Aquimarina sp. ERC-38 TaxID=2949996 RepID=UPI0022485AF4|nr:HTTM domain-containing protein [Aquimarina sp. ERC-38]UZO80429.1 HTTM domain-containing protein [Aquimarina sp. ERC-38]
MILPLTYFKKHTDAAPLAVFRILFGIMMCISIIRFWSYGWIDKLYIQPNFFFSYYGFEWVKPMGAYTYILFVICGLSALFITIGFKYRIAIVSFFLSFTYIELMDKTTYLNHYYFISILSFLLIFLPANAYFSIDAYYKGYAYRKIPQWCMDAIKILLTIVYFYAGLAKLNSDWLLHAMPLKIWLPSKFDTPLLGDLLQKEWVHYLFSYSGALYDLCIPALLWYRKTRGVAFFLVVIFHVLTRVLFPIGMFPYIMIVSAMVFFDAGIHHKILNFVNHLLPFNEKSVPIKDQYDFSLKNKKIIYPIIGCFFLVQLALPFRYVLYPGELFWTEQGYRFSWRVMLMEKAGYITFKVVDQKTNKRFYVNNRDFLTSFQEKQMATQPDFILEYAHYLEDFFETKNQTNVSVYADSYVTLNGRLSTPFVDPEVDLTLITDSFKHKDWIIPFQDEIKGL